jgi:ABC-2 type transport system permease protein
MPVGAWAIYKRELKSTMRRTSTWVAFGLLFSVVGLYFIWVLGQFAQESRDFERSFVISLPDAPNLTRDVVQVTYGFLSFMLLFVIPLLTMRTIASERASHTLEILVTCPIGDWSILLGKYLALVTLGAGVVAIALSYPLAVYILTLEYPVTAPEASAVVSCSLGLFMIFASYGAFGLMASAMTESQVTASIVTMAGLILWHMVGEVNPPRPEMREWIAELSALRRTENLFYGLVSLRDLVFFATASCFFLFVAARALESRRWRA